MNELQKISLDGNRIRLSQNGDFVDLLQGSGDDTDDQNLQLNGTKFHKKKGDNLKNYRSLSIEHA